MVQWGNNSETGKWKYLEENLSRCYYACLKSHVDSDGTESRRPESLTNTWAMASPKVV